MSSANRDSSLTATWHPSHSAKYTCGVVCLDGFLSQAHLPASPQVMPHMRCSPKHTSLKGASMHSRACASTMPTFVNKQTCLARTCHGKNPQRMHKHTCVAAHSRCKPCCRECCLYASEHVRAPPCSTRTLPYAPEPICRVSVISLLSMSCTPPPKSGTGDAPTGAAAEAAESWFSAFVPPLLRTPPGQMNRSYNREHRGGAVWP